MTMNGTRGYQPGLVDLASGQISREIFVNDDHTGVVRPEAFGDQRGVGRGFSGYG